MPNRVRVRCENLITLPKNFNSHNVFPYMLKFNMYHNNFLKTTMYFIHTLYYKLHFVVSKVKTQIGGKTNISWTAAYFPSSGHYHVYHTYKENRTIFSISSSGVNYGGVAQSTKYTYNSRPFNSTNIVFEIRDITLYDAGYYNGGMFANAAGSGGGVVLIVSGK